MKVLVLTACLAVTAAVAADLKDPAAVAQDWAQVVTQARGPFLPTTLAAQSKVPALKGPEAARSFKDPVLPAAPESPRLHPGPLYDAPSRPRVRRAPPEIPDSAIPWLYRDQTYWVVPLGGPAN
jgi:hypothetical protein